MQIRKRKIDLIVLSPLLLLFLLPLGFFISPYITQTAAKPEIALHKYFSIPLTGLSFGLVIFLFMVRNNLNLHSARFSYIKKNGTRLMVAVGGICLIWFAILAILRYTSLHTSVFDMGTYDRRIWQISASPLNHIPYVLTDGHFQPVLFFYGMLYKIIASPVIIQFLQAVFTVSGVLPIYLIGRNALNNTGFAALISITYLLYPAVGFNASLDFHPDHLFIPAMLWAFYFAEKEQYVKSIFFVGIGSMAKEPYILGASFFGLYLLFSKKQYWTGIISFLFFLFLFCIVVYVILPITNRVTLLEGGTFPFMEQATVFSSIKLFAGTLTIWKTRKLLFIWFLMMPLLFLPLLGWRKHFLPAIPLITIPLLSTVYLHSSVDSQYTAGIIAPAFTAFIFSLKNIAEKISQKYAYAVAVLAVVMTITFNISHGPGPLSIGFWKAEWTEIWHKSAYTSGNHENIIREIIYKVPEDPNLNVVSQGNINHKRLAHRYNHHTFPESVKDADYILLDLNRPHIVGDRVDEKAYMEELERLKNNHNFQLDFEQDGVMVFKKQARLKLPEHY